MFGGRLKAYRLQGAQPRARHPKDRAPVDEGSQSQKGYGVIGQVRYCMFGQLMRQAWQQHAS